MDTCTHTPGDVDGDGVSSATDSCPWLYDPGQEDADEDGKGDVCDLCPDEPNPDDEACSFLLADIRDSSSERHPAEGTSVYVTDLVVTDMRAGVGFFVQDPDASVYGGIFVYDGGTYSSEDGESTVSPGDQVSITGVYDEYYDLSQISSPSVEFTGTVDVPAPIDISSTCDVGTGGALQEAYESMLVTIHGPVVTDSNPDTPDDYGEFEVDGCLRIDDFLSDVLVPQPAVDTTYSSLSGIMNFTYGHSKLGPRGASDIVE
jgi:hypothetical protein